MDQDLKEGILQIIQRVSPFDEVEQTHIHDTISWIKSGAELFRIQKPDIPPKHLVSYFVVVDPKENRILLVDHKKAQLWLPAGGHVEPGEHPQATVERESEEELGIRAVFIFEGAFFLTQAITVGLTAGHTDVSLWYVLRGDSTQPLHYDPAEFNGYKWFTFGEVLETPVEKLDPHLHRFVKKWQLQIGVRSGIGELW